MDRADSSLGPPGRFTSHVSLPPVLGLVLGLGLIQAAPKHLHFPTGDFDTGNASRSHGACGEGDVPSPSCFHKSQCNQWAAKGSETQRPGGERGRWAGLSAGRVGEAGGRGLARLGGATRGGPGSRRPARRPRRACSRDRSARPLAQSSGRAKMAAEREPPPLGGREARRL